MQTNSKPKYKDGTRVIYKGLIFTVIDSYFKDYGSPGWFYNLDNHNAQAVPEAQIGPLTAQNKAAEWLDRKLNK